MQLETTGFSPAPDAICQDKELGPIAAVVFGKVWRYCQMSDRVCCASLDRIAQECGISRNTALLYVKKLCEKGWITDGTPTFKDKPHLYFDTGKFRLRLSFEEVETPEPKPVSEESKICTPGVKDLDSRGANFGHKEDDGGDDEDEEKLTVPQKAERMSTILEKRLRIQALPVIRESILQIASRVSIAFFRECVDVAAKNNAYSWQYVEKVITSGGPRATEKRPKPSPRAMPGVAPRVAANGGQQLAQKFIDY